MQTQTLLIADDSIPTQRVIQLTFASQAIRVVVAGDGHQALALIDAERPDIIFACTSVPGVDGYGIARYVSRQGHLPKVPVFLLRNAFEANDEQKIKESRASGVLDKPLDPAVLIHCVKHALSIIEAPAGEGATAPKPRKARKSPSQPKPSARQTPHVQGLPGFEAACDPMAFALNNETSVMTTEMLAKNVSDAVSQLVGQAVAQAITQAIAGLPLALAGIQQAHASAPATAMQANAGSVAVATSAANALKARAADAPVVVHGDMTTMAQLRRDMGIDDFVFEDALFRGNTPGMSAHPQVEMDAFALPSSTASFDPIRSSAGIEREPADVLGNWDEELKWLAAEIGTTRAPDAAAPDQSRDFGTSEDTLAQQALPVRVGAWLKARDMSPGLAMAAAETMAGLRAGTAQLFEPFRGGQLRVWPAVVWLAGASAVLRAIGKGY